MSDARSRERERLAFLRRCLGSRHFAVRSASADASFRRYFRVLLAEGSLILMDAPPEREDCRPWLEVAARLRAAGLRAPAVHEADLEAGLLLIEDFGDTLYLDRLRPDTAEALYGEALEALAVMQTRADERGAAALRRGAVARRARSPPRVVPRAPSRLRAGRGGAGGAGVELRQP
ncbi:MAG: phosphotransferase [Xanthomonadales bacterium]|nr:phosphotransferase [Xanthomonadales bacterium]